MNVKLVLFVVVVVVPGKIVFAAPEISGQTIHACVSKFEGFTRIVASQRDCVSEFEVYTAWQQTGPAGVAGPTGSAGPAGVMGVPGLTGAKGATGPASPAGVPGAAGQAGPAGVAGATGAPGAVGSVGATGISGTVGPQGPTGVTGAAGMSFGQTFLGNRTLIPIDFTPVPFPPGPGTVQMGITDSDSGGSSISATPTFPAGCNATMINITFANGGGSSAVDAQLVRTSASSPPVTTTQELCSLTLNNGLPASCSAPAPIVFAPGEQTFYRFVYANGTDFTTARALTSLVCQ